MTKINFSRFFLIISVLLFVGAGCLSIDDGSGGVVTSGPAGIFVSADKAESWTHLTSLPESDGIKNIGNINIYRVYTDPQDPNTMYVGTRGQGMYYTYDNGKTWQRPDFAPLNNGFVYSIAVHPKDKCLIYVSNGVQIFKSVDCNRTYEEVYREVRGGVTAVSLVFENFSPYRIYMGQSNGDLLQSADGGQSWQTIQRFGFSLVEIKADLFQRDRLYITTRSEGLHRSDNGGQSWINLTDVLSSISGGLDYRGFVLHPSKPNTVYWLSTYGIIFSTNAGNEWQKFDLITPPGTVYVYSFALNPRNDKEMYYAATLKDFSRSTFYKSIDGGVNWTTKKLPSGQVPTVLRAHPEKDFLYLGFTIPPSN